MKVKFETLANGVRLAVAQNKHANSIVAMIGVGVGSRHEPKGLHGVAHFIEHTFFKGTPRRPSAKKIAAEVEALGGNFNAFTDKEHMAFHVHVSKEDGLVAVDVLHDMMQNALFRTSDIEKERSVICEEISMYDNEPSSNVWEASETHAYQGTGLEHRITGNIEDITYSAAQLRKFQKSHFVAGRTMVVLAGAVSEEVIASAREKFGQLEARINPVEIMAPNGFAPGYLFGAGKTDRLHLVARFPGVTKEHPDYRPMFILSNLLGGYSSARLYQSIREEKSLCYGIWSSLHSYSDTGAMLVNTSFDRDKLSKMVKSLRAEIKSVTKGSIPGSEFEAAKTYSRGALLLAFEDTMNVATDVIHQVFTHGKYTPLEERIKDLQSVSLSDVMGVARKYLDLDKMHIAVVGPEKARKEVRLALE